MKKPVSLYLDVVRFSAAMAVFISHLGSYPLSTNGLVWWRLTTYGTIAVTIFFVLSGYVIAHVVSTTEKDASHYFRARAARLYSVLLFALVLTILFDKLGMALDPSLYTFKKVLWKPESWQGYLSTLFFVDEFQVFRFHGIAAGTNTPLWSLSFEATYYVVAGLMLFSSKRIWIPASALILILAGKTITALLPVWALGYFIYNRNIGTRLPKPLLAAGALLTIILIALMPQILDSLPKSLSDNFGVWLPWGEAPFDRDLIGDYLVAALFAINIICVHNLASTETHLPAGVQRFIRRASAVTFPLYCIHYPAMCFFTAVSPWPTSSMADVTTVFLMVMGLAIAATPVCDQLKRMLRNLNLHAMPAHGASAAGS
jgi:peptidoglycan/LPS O-acetylase OafA/YrhL